MARPNLTDLESVKDPLQTWNWSLLLPNIPGSNLGRDLTIKCVSSAIPGSTVEQVPVEAHGMKLNFAGRRTWSGTWTATFFETRDAGTRAAFVSWLELTRSWENNTGSYKEDYAVTGSLELYDDLPQVVKTIKIRGLFVQDLSEVSLDQTSGVITYSVTFSFDRTDDA